MYVPRFNYPRLRYCGSLLSSHHLSLLVSLLPSPSGMIKVNFDRCVTSSVAATAYVIRDQHASLI